MLNPVWGGEVLHQICGSQIQHVNNNWTKSDLGVWENEGVKQI